MIELIVLEHLRGMLRVPVEMERPENPPGQYVLMERTGGREQGHLHEATFAIQSYGETLYQAASLNEEVKKAMRTITTKKEVFKNELNADYNFTDTTRKEHRYQAVFHLIYQEE